MRFATEPTVKVGLREHSLLYFDRDLDPNGGADGMNLAFGICQNGIRKKLASILPVRLRNDDVVSLEHAVANRCARSVALGVWCAYRRPNLPRKLSDNPMLPRQTPHAHGHHRPPDRRPESKAPRAHPPTRGRRRPAVRRGYEARHPARAPVRKQNTWAAGASRPETYARPRCAHRTNWGS